MSKGEVLQQVPEQRLVHGLGAPELRPVRTIGFSVDRAQAVAAAEGLPLFDVRKQNGSTTPKQK